jgi:transcriptional regulator with XRE-family HTH domain
MPRTPNSELRTSAASPPSLGARIRAARGAMPRHKLAAVLGCEPQSIYRWERGEREPSLATLRRLAQALGTSPAALVGEADP